MRVILITTLLFVFSILPGARDTHSSERKTEASAIKLALTIDDLPSVGPLSNGDVNASQAVERIAAVLRVHQAPATGFVVCD
ncbi:MAG: hypothetical protein ACRD4B_09890, partial [Acidobacteriota bacterium]